MRRQIVPALRMLGVMTVLVGVLYGATVTGIAQIVFHGASNGSLVEAGGLTVGSSLLGQPFRGPEYFHPRPSAVDYDAAGSGATNYGPTNPEFLETVAARVGAYRTENGLDDGVAVPVDAVTASASGLDPHISVRNARLQAPRVAAARGLDLDTVLDLVARATSPPDLGFLSEPAVNVVTLNLMLDEATGADPSTLQP